MKNETIKAHLRLSKDIRQITGKSERYSRNLIEEIKMKQGKQKNQLVTIKELCDHTGLPLQQVTSHLT